MNFTFESLLQRTELGLYTQVDVWSDSGQRLVVLHTHPHLIVHGQPGCLPDVGAYAVSHRVGRGSSEADGNQIRDRRWRINAGLLQSNYTEHCSVGSTNLLTTITAITARMKKERKISTVAGRGH